MNQKAFIKIEDKILNLVSLECMEFSELEKTVFIKLEQSEHKFKFEDEKEFERLRTYMRILSSQFESAKEIPVDKKNNLLN